VCGTQSGYGKKAQTQTHTTVVRSETETEPKGRCLSLLRSLYSLQGTYVVRILVVAVVVTVVVAVAVVGVVVMVIVGQVHNLRVAGFLILISRVQLHSFVLCLYFIAVVVVVAVAVTVVLLVAVVVVDRMPPSVSSGKRGIK